MQVGYEKSRFRTNSWLSINDCYNVNNKCDGPSCSLLHRQRCISESMFITACSMDDHNKGTEQNRFYQYTAVNLKPK